MRIAKLDLVNRQRVADAGSAATQIAAAPEIAPAPDAAKSYFRP
jgi:hypothetical protein